MNNFLATDKGRSKKKSASKQTKLPVMQDSSPDLSLKLRRGSSDSRDSFYMDFAQGIDSDIEEVTATTSGFIHQDIPDDASTPTAPTIKDDPIWYVAHIKHYL